MSHTLRSENPRISCGGVGRGSYPRSGIYAAYFAPRFERCYNNGYNLPEESNTSILANNLLSCTASAVRFYRALYKKRERKKRTPQAHPTDLPSRAVVSVYFSLFLIFLSIYLSTFPQLSPIVLRTASLDTCFLFLPLFFFSFLTESRIILTISCALIIDKKDNQFLK